jgi:hypothetical protein
MKITIPSGTSLEFDNEPKHKTTCDDGDASQPGIHMLVDQICWTPRFETIICFIWKFVLVWLILMLLFYGLEA